MWRKKAGEKVRRKRGGRKKGEKKENKSISIKKKQR
jgi:hypothetical protein